MCSCCYGYSWAKTFRWNSSYLTCRCFIKKKKPIMAFDDSWKVWCSPFWKERSHAFSISMQWVFPPPRIWLLGFLWCVWSVFSPFPHPNAILNGRWWELRLLPGIGPPPSTCRPGTTRWKISPSPTLRSVTPTAPSNAPAQFVLTIPR